MEAGLLILIEDGVLGEEEDDTLPGGLRQPGQQGFEIAHAVAVPRQRLERRRVDALSDGSLQLEEGHEAVQCAIAKPLLVADVEGITVPRLERLEEGAAGLELRRPGLVVVGWEELPAEHPPHEDPEAVEGPGGLQPAIHALRGGGSGDRPIAPAHLEIATGPVHQSSPVGGHHLEGAQADHHQRRIHPVQQAGDDLLVADAGAEEGEVVETQIEIRRESSEFALDRGLPRREPRSGVAEQGDPDLRVASRPIQLRHHVVDLPEGRAPHVPLHPQRLLGPDQRAAGERCVDRDQEHEREQPGPGGRARRSPHAGQ